MIQVAEQKIEAEVSEGCSLQHGCQILHGECTSSIDSCCCCCWRNHNSKRPLPDDTFSSQQKIILTACASTPTLCSRCRAALNLTQSRGQTQSLSSSPCGQTMKGTSSGIWFEYCLNAVGSWKQTCLDKVRMLCKVPEKWRVGCKHDQGCLACPCNWGWQHRQPHGQPAGQN